METNDENVYLIANSLIKKLELPIEDEISLEKLSILSEHYQKNYYVIKDLLMRVTFYSKRIPTLIRKKKRKKGEK